MEVGSRFPVGPRHSPRQRPYRSWGAPSLLFGGCRGSTRVVMRLGREAYHSHLSNAEAECVTLLQRCRSNLTWWMIDKLLPAVVTPGLTLSSSTFCPHSVVTCFVWIWAQIAIISLYSVNWLVCITETESVYCAVRTGCLNVFLSCNFHPRYWNRFERGN